MSNPVTGNPAPAEAEKNRLLPNEQLGPGQRLVSPDGRFVLIMQKDGNLVEYAPGNRAVWA
ncbi:MAG: S8 family serine peptidase, partial [Gemmatimonadales bacterium]